ncbi:MULTISPECIES: DUF2806 domain-containing protein [Pseudomonas]|uniref:DUF2806 domain-containing protein n=1 Tax=Pseudomonas TaxID=286 RepID=UPI0021CA1C72|nr:MULTISPECIES: DUF2806 domain-containing protein [Pseudomonas]MCU7261146.1 DUF2806 domain-containing protein [Pseudomonas koreensis]
MWETLSEKMIGSYLKPYQLRRVGEAELDLMRIGKLISAQAEREADEIRKGNKDISDFSRKIEFKKIAKSNYIAERLEPTIDAVHLIEGSYRRAAIDATRKEVNVAKSILYAEEVLVNDPQEPPADDVDDDWLYRWRDCSSEVSSSDMQRLWGRLLAGEVKSPGMYSLRCLDFLRNLSQAEAKLIEEISCFEIQGMLVKQAVDERCQFEDLLQLEDLGVLSGVASGGLTNNVPLSMQLTDAELEWQLRADKLCLTVKSLLSANRLELKAYRITPMGQQIIALGRLPDDVDYIRAVGKIIARMHFKVTVCEYHRSGEYIMVPENQEIITPD